MAQRTNRPKSNVKIRLASPALLTVAIRRSKQHITSNRKVELIRLRHIMIIIRTTEDEATRGFY